jgi:hypothetical protein
MEKSDSQPTITCPKCGMVSGHPEDISQKYCGNCHQFHDQMELFNESDLRISSSTEQDQK